MFFIVTFLIISISIISFSLYTGISPMPSSQAAQQAIARSISPKANKIYELGSGWGSLAFAISKHYPHAAITAFELSPFPWLISLLRHIRRKGNITFYRKNFFKQSLQEAEVIVCYLYPGAMKKLKEKFEKELQPGSLVITNTFRVPGWVPRQTIVLNNAWRTQIFIYVVT